MEGLRETARRLDEVGLRAQRPEPVMRDSTTRRLLQASEVRRFAHTRGWRRITPEWIEEKRRRGLDPRVMRATGRLEDTLTSQFSSSTQFGAHDGVLRWGLRWRSEFFYASVQATRGRRSVVIDTIARRAIVARIQQYIATGER